MRRFAFALCFVAAACSDTGTTSTDAGVDASGEPDMATVLSGSLVAPGNFNIVDVTPNDTLLVQAAANTATPVGISALPLSGGTPKSIDDTTSTFFAIGNLVFSWAGESTIATTSQGRTYGAGTLSIYSTATGMKWTSDKSSVVGYVAASSDGSEVLFLESSDGATGNIWMVKPDGSGLVELVKNSALNLTDDTLSCAPAIDFHGTTPLVAYCPAAPTSGTDGGAGDLGGGGAGTGDMGAGTADLGAPAGDMGAGVADLAVAGDLAAPADMAAATMVAPATLSSFDASGKETVLATNVAPTIVVQPNAGDAIVINDPNFLPSFLSFSTGKKTPIDTAPSVEAVFSPDGSTLFYTTFPLGKGDLKSIPVSGGSPSTIVSGMATGFVTDTQGNPAITADGKHLIFFSQLNSSGYSDLHLVATAPGSKPTTLTSSTTGVIFGDPFTADQSRVLYCTGAQAATGVAAFFSAPVAGGMPVEHAKHMWVAFNTKGTTVIYNDNVKAVGKNQLNEKLDIFSVDTAAGASTQKTLVTQAQANFFLSHDRTKLIYSYVSSDTSKSGVYVAPLQ